MTERFHGNHGPVREPLAEDLLDLPPPPEFTREHDMGGTALATRGKVKDEAAIDEAIAKALGTPERLRGQFERLGEEAQIDRMRRISDAFLAIVKATKDLGGTDTKTAVRAVRDHFGISTSDAHYGLLFGVRSRVLRMEEDRLEAEED
jgi:hypothetical protein